MIDTTVSGGIVGIALDCRGRPFRLPEDKRKRIENLNKWFTAIDLYPQK
jgi:hypothetical protein